MTVGPVEVTTDSWVTFAVTVEPGRYSLEMSVTVLTMVETLETNTVDITVVCTVVAGTDDSRCTGPTAVVFDVTTVEVNVVVLER